MHLKRLIQSTVWRFTRDPYTFALKYASKHPEGFTLGALCRKSGIPSEQCKKLQTEFIHGGMFTQLSETRDTEDGQDQHVYALSFNGRSQLLAQEMNSQTKMIGFLTAAMIGLVAAQLIVAKQQVYYAEVQSRGDRIFQAQSIQNAIEFCKQNPEAQESGVRDTTTGKPATCSQVLDQY